MDFILYEKYILHDYTDLFPGSLTVATQLLANANKLSAHQDIRELDSISLKAAIQRGIDRDQSDEQDPCGSTRRQCQTDLLVNFLLLQLNPPTLHSDRSFHNSLVVLFRLSRELLPHSDNWPLSCQIFFVHRAYSLISKFGKSDSAIEMTEEFMELMPYVVSETDVWDSFDNALAHGIFRCRTRDASFENGITVPQCYQELLDSPIESIPTDFRSVPAKGVKKKSARPLLHWGYDCWKK